MRKVKYPVSINKMFDDNKVYYMASVVDYPNCITDGETVEEAIENIKDAMSLLLCDTEDDKLIPPTPIENIKSWSEIVEVESLDLDEYSESIKSNSSLNTDTINIITAYNRNLSKLNKAITDIHNLIDINNMTIDVINEIYLLMNDAVDRIELLKEIVESKSSIIDANKSLIFVDYIKEMENKKQMELLKKDKE